MSAQSQTFGGGFHHSPSSCGVDIDHIHTKPSDNLHSTADGIGNIVQLEVEKNVVSTPLYLLHEAVSFGIEKLHTDLYEGKVLTEEMVYSIVTEVHDWVDLETELNEMPYRFSF